MITSRSRERLRELALSVGAELPPKATTEQLLSAVEQAFDQLKRHLFEAARQQRRFALAMSAMTQGAAVCDEGGNVVLRNAFARTFADARHGEVLVGASIDQLLKQALSGHIAEREVELYGPPRRVLYVSARPLVDDDESYGAIATIDDFTEQQRLDAMRRDLVANVSHELRTPIGAIAVLAETLSDEQEPEVVRRLGARLRDESFRVAHMIDDLLALSEIEAEGLRRVEHLRIVDIIAEAIARVRSSAEQRDITIRVSDFPPELALRGDRRQLTSALGNLLENAVKYSDRESTVEVRAAGDGERVSMVVEDHGIGIPEKDLNRVFERFYRVDKARSRETGGAGLGLSIVRHVAINHGGTISVSSREGEGSTFMMMLPTSLVGADAV